MSRRKPSTLSLTDLFCGEVWLPIPGLPRYSVSSEGRVRMLSGRIHGTHQVAGGYLRAGLIGPDRRQRNYLIHRLVALAFIGPCPDGMEVNHKNGIAADNCLANLEYVTPRENVTHSIRVLGRRRAQAENHGNAALTNDQVRALRVAWASGEFATKHALALHFAVSDYVCGDLLNGKTYRAVA